MPSARRALGGNGKILQLHTTAQAHFRTKETVGRARGPNLVGSATAAAGLSGSRWTLKLLEGAATDRAGGGADGGLAFGELAGAAGADCLRGERLTLVIERGEGSKTFFQNSSPCQADERLGGVFCLVAFESISAEAVLEKQSF